MKVLTGVKEMLAAAVAAAGLAAFAENNPTITLKRVQQRYPWNGLVDIDFNVELNGNDGNQYYVRLQSEVNEGGNIRTQTMGEFLDLAGLTNAVSGLSRVTWNTALDYSGFLVKNAKVTAQLMRHDGDDDKLSRTPYFCPWCYTVIDVSGGPGAKSYPHWNEYLENMEVSTNKFNTEEYKTNKIVLRRIQPGKFQIGADDVGHEEGQGYYDNGYDYEIQHYVTLTKPYYIGMFEITRAQWRNVVAVPQDLSDQDYVGTEGIVPMSKIGFDNICGEINSSFGSARSPVSKTLTCRRRRSGRMPAARGRRPRPTSVTMFRVIRNFAKSICGIRIRAVTARCITKSAFSFRMTGVSMICWAMRRKVALTDMNVIWARSLMVIVGLKKIRWVALATMPLSAEAHLLIILCMSARQRARRGA